MGTWAFDYDWMWYCNGRCYYLVLGQVLSLVPKYNKWIMLYLPLNKSLMHHLNLHFMQYHNTHWHRVTITNTGGPEANTLSSQPYLLHMFWLQFSHDGNSIFNPAKSFKAAQQRWLVPCCLLLHIQSLTMKSTAHNVTKRSCYYYEMVPKICEVEAVLINEVVCTPQLLWQYKYK